MAAPEEGAATAGSAAETSFHVAAHGRCAFQFHLLGAGWTSGTPLLAGDWLAALVHAADETRIFRPTDRPHASAPT